VFPADVNGNKDGELEIFRLNEKSSCCARQCCPGSGRPYEMYMSELKERAPGTH